MNLDNALYDIETHPIVVAIGIFIVFFVGFNIFKKKTTAATVTPTGLVDTSHVTTLETYNQSFNSYPTVPGSSTTVTPPPPTTIPPPTPIIKPPVTPAPIPKPIPVPVPITHGTTIHPAPWPAQTSTLSGIAQHYGKSLQTIQQLNGWILQQRGTWNLIYPSDNIRVS